MPETAQPGAYKPASGSDIKEILGQADIDLVTSVLHTGASRGEILQACEWLDDDDYIGAELHKPMYNRIRRVYDILLRNQERDQRD